jgi:hypothetical protein
VACARGGNDKGLPVEKMKQEKAEAEKRKFVAESFGKNPIKPDDALNKELYEKIDGISAYTKGDSQAAVELEVDFAIAGEYIHATGQIDKKDEVEFKPLVGSDKYQVQARCKNAACKLIMIEVKEVEGAGSSEKIRRFYGMFSSATGPEAKAHLAKNKAELKTKAAAVQKAKLQSQQKPDASAQAPQAPTAVDGKLLEDARAVCKQTLIDQQASNGLSKLVLSETSMPTGGKPKPDFEAFLASKLKTLAQSCTVSDLTGPQAAASAPSANPAPSTSTNSAPPPPATNPAPAENSAPPANNPAPPPADGQNQETKEQGSEVKPEHVPTVTNAQPAQPTNAGEAKPMAPQQPQPPAKN